MTLEEVFETGHLELLGYSEEVTLAEFLRWLRARADQFEQSLKDNRDPDVDDWETYKAEVGDWIDSLIG